MDTEPEIEPAKEDGGLDPEDVYDQVERIGYAAGEAASKTYREFNKHKPPSGRPTIEVIVRYEDDAVELAYTTTLGSKQ